MPPDLRLGFGTFEFDLSTRELRKRGLRLKLQGKPAAVLCLLLRSAGKVISQEQLHTEVWPDDTFGDFKQRSGVAIWKLRTALGDTAENPRFIETLPSRGYRFIAPVRELNAEGLASKKMIAVLPFEDLGTPTTDYFAEGLTEELITQLGRLNPQGLGVIARSSAIRFKASDKSLREIATELNVRYLAMGTVRRVANRLRVTAQLVLAEDESNLWTDSYDRVAEDAIRVQVDVAEHIAKALSVELLPQQQALVARTRPRSLEAYEFYLQGRYHWSKRATPSLMTAIEYFQRAIAADATYALAYTGLADCYSVIGFYGEMSPADAFGLAKSYATQALQLDNDLAEAHSSLAFSLLQFDWDERAAEREHLQAIQLNPNCAPAHHWYGLSLTQLGRFSEALTSLQRAQALDPFSVAIQAHIGRLSYFSHDYDRAVHELRRATELDPSYVPARYFLPLAKLQCGAVKEAVAELEVLVSGSQDHPILVSGLACAYAKAHKRAAAERTIERLIALPPPRRVPPYFVAIAWAAMKRADEAFACLEQAFTERYGWLFYLKMEPAFDALRSDSRFADLLKRIAPKERARHAAR